MSRSMSNDQVDSLVDSARYITIPARRNGKTMWLSSVTSVDSARIFCTSQSVIDNSDRIKMINQMIADEELHKPDVKWPIVNPDLKAQSAVKFISDDLEDCEKGVPNMKLIDTPFSQ